MHVLLRALRVYQYPKNLLVFAAVLFAGELTEPVKLGLSVAAFAVMCCASSTVYILNDLKDVDKDRQHPAKRSRPFASGALRMRTGYLMAALLFAMAGIGALLINLPFTLAVALYLALNLSYSYALKNVIFIDMMTVALGFVIRAVAGALAIGVVFSNWLVVCTLFLALFLVLGKRRHELMLLEEGAAGHRAVLAEYTTQLLDYLILIMASSTLVVYVIYTGDQQVIQRFGTDRLYLTVPFVVYGLFRYMYLVHKHNGGGDPSRTLLTDGPILAAVLLWGLVSTGILYFDGNLGQQLP